MQVSQVPAVVLSVLSKVGGVVMKPNSKSELLHPFASFQPLALAAFSCFLPGLEVHA